MKKKSTGILIVAVLAAVLSNCNQCDKSVSTGTYERVERYETGQVSRKFRLVNGMKEGLMTDYYNDGKLMAERQFQHDKQHGKTLVYYPNGAIKEVQYYDRGIRYGGDTLFYENGSIQFVTTFLEGKKNGYMRKWDTLGNLIYEARYKHDTVVEIMGKAVGK